MTASAPQASASWTAIQPTTPAAPLVTAVAGMPARTAGNCVVTADRTANEPTDATTPVARRAVARRERSRA